MIQGDVINVSEYLDRVARSFNEELDRSTDAAEKLMVEGVQDTILREDRIAQEDFFNSISSDRLLSNDGDILITVFSKDNPKKVHAIVNGLEPGEALPPRPPVLAWMQARGIMPNAGETPEDVADRIRWHVFNYGTEGTPIFSLARQRYAYRIVTILRQGAKRGAERASRQ